MQEWVNASDIIEKNLRKLFLTKDAYIEHVGIILNKRDPHIAIRKTSDHPVCSFKLYYC